MQHQTNQQQLQVASKNWPTLLPKQNEILLAGANKLGTIALQIFQAKNDVRLADIPLASEGPETDAIDLITRLRVMVGQNKDHTPAQLEIEARFLTNTFGDLSVQDINIAVDLFLTNRLDIDLPTYVIFSPLFLSHIFNAYKRYRMKTLKEIDESCERELLLIETDVDAKRVEGMRECILECVEHGKAGFEHRFYNKMVYDFLRKSSRMKLTPQLITEAKAYGERTFLDDRAKNLSRKPAVKGAVHIGEALIKNPAETMNRSDAERSYAEDYLLNNYFANTNVKAMLSTIAVSELPSNK